MSYVHEHMFDPAGTESHSTVILILDTFKAHLTKARTLAFNEDNVTRCAIKDAAFLVRAPTTPADDNAGSFCVR